MSATEANATAISPDVQADLQEVLRRAATEGMVRDAQLIARVTARSEQAREQLRQAFGEQEFIVDIIREMRGSR